MIRAIDETGNTYGYLRVESRVGNGRKGQIRWRCKCKCGKYTSVRGANLRQGLTKSCGCLKKEEKCDAADKDVIRAMYANGYSVVHIAAYIHISTGTVYKYLRAFK